MTNIDKIKAVNSKIIIENTQKQSYNSIRSNMPDYIYP